MSTTIRLYSASELQTKYPDGFDRALENWQSNQDEIFWMDETIESLKALIKASGLTLRDYSLGAYSHSYIRIDWNDDFTPELSGQRALAWLENNLLDGLREHKPFIARIWRDETGKPIKQGGKYHVFHRNGKIPDCPFTGYFADDVYLNSLIESINEGYNLHDSYKGLADECRKLLEQEAEAQNSEEYFIDHADANEYQFTRDGQRVY